jgi:GntR family transcriptional regulator, transcriptional repressor for pyruvate dehydrogenase complex
MLLGAQNHIKERSRLAELIAERIGEWVSARDLKPGDRLPSEPELVGHFGVARTVVREAISKLRALGVLEVHQGKGAFVAQLPIELLFLRIRRLKTQPNELDNVWELREILESRIAELAAERRTRNDMTALEAAMNELGKPAEPGKLWDEAFHHSLAKAARNPILEEMLHELVNLVGPIIGNSNIQRKTLPAEMRAILEAVRDGDSNRARDAMLSHLRQRKRLFEALTV